MSAAGPDFVACWIISMVPARTTTRAVLCRSAAPAMCWVPIPAIWPASLRFRGNCGPTSKNRFGIVLCRYLLGKGCQTKNGPKSQGTFLPEWALIPMPGSGIACATRTKTTITSTWLFPVWRSTHRAGAAEMTSIKPSTPRKRWKRRMALNSPLDLRRAAKKNHYQRGRSAAIAEPGKCRIG